MVDIVAEDTAAEDIAVEKDTATPGIVAGWVFGCTAVARVSTAPCRKEDTGSDNNICHSRA